MRVTVHLGLLLNCDSYTCHDSSFAQLPNATMSTSGKHHGVGTTQVLMSHLMPPPVWDCHLKLDTLPGPVAACAVACARQSTSSPSSCVASPATAGAACSASPQPHSSMAGRPLPDRSPVRIVMHTVDTFGLRGWQCSTYHLDQPRRSAGRA